jgi:hypothetical protein
MYKEINGLNLKNENLEEGICKIQPFRVDFEIKLITHQMYSMIVMKRYKSNCKIYFMKF